MEKSLTHLPKNKRKEVREILSVILEEAKPEKVILFGSHASEKWVEDEYIENGIRYSYISDYDFLVVIKKNGEKEQAIISHIENRTSNYKNAVSPIVHDIEYINEGLRFGQYFFTEIIRDGILLYDTGKYEFTEPTILTPQEEKEKAQGYFDIWFPRAIEFLDIASDCLKKERLNMGAFLVHQATECSYNTALLVFTGYKPKTHNLEKLRNYAKNISPELYNVFSTSTGNDREYRLFDLLKRGYIDARYKDDYYITTEELQTLIERVTRMQTIVENICQKKLREIT